MKAVLVIEMPECCYDCDFCRFDGGYMYGYYGRNCLITGEYVQNNNFDITTSRHETCPLRPMPRKLDANDWHRMFGGKYKEREAKGYGWNACLDEILGETE